ncbi:MAG: BPSS1780 family membrane protein [Betaproteobacteria bacterium]
MQISRLPARTGFRWVLDGFRLLRRQPVALVAISFLNLALMGVSMIVPIIGSLGPLILTPTLMVGMMQAVRTAEAGQNPSPLTLFAGFREDRGRAWKPLLGLGAINAVATVLALAASAMAGGDALVQMATGRLDPGDPTLSDASLAWALLVFMLIYLPIQLATWYAPMFIAWDRVPLLKSMFFSIAAILRNRWAFMTYALGWVAFAVAASIVLRLLQGLLAGSPLLWSIVMMPLWLVGISAVYCSFWATYRDAVDRNPRPVAPDDQPPMP